VSASRNGEVIITLGLNLGVPVTPTGVHNGEVFRIDHDGKPIQLTNLFGHLGWAQVSYDGSTVCFGSKTDRNAPVDLMILDLGTNKVSATGLLAKIRSQPGFTGD